MSDDANADAPPYEPLARREVLRAGLLLWLVTAAGTFLLSLIAAKLGATAFKPHALAGIAAALICLRGWKLTNRDRMRIVGWSVLPAIVTMAPILILTTPDNAPWVALGGFGAFISMCVFGGALFGLAHFIGVFLVTKRVRA